MTAVDPGCDIYRNVTSGDKAIVGGILVGVVGAAIGAWTGYLIGHRDRYVF